MPGISCSKGSTTPGTWAEYSTRGQLRGWPFSYGGNDAGDSLFPMMHKVKQERPLLPGL